MLGGIFHSYSNIQQENSGDPDKTPRSAASGLGRHCLTMSHKKDAILIWVNVKKYQTRILKLLKYFTMFTI